MSASIRLYNIFIINENLNDEKTIHNYSFSNVIYSIIQN